MAEGFGFSLEKGAERTHVLKQTPMEPVENLNRWLNSNQLNKDEIINTFQDEVYKLVQINHSMQRNNDYLETQHEQDLCHAKSLKDQLHQLQYDNNLLYDEIERQKRELLSDNDKLIKENKTLIVERDNLRKQRDELTKKLNGEANYADKSKPFLSDEQTKNNYLKTKTTYVVGHTNCERRVSFYKNKATIIDKQCRNLLEENSQLKNQTAELRKERNAIQTRYEKRFSRDVPVTFTNRGNNGSTHSPKLTGKGRPPKQSEKTTTSEDDDSTIAYIQFLHKECGKWKLMNEHLNTRIEELENKLLTNNHQLSSFENEVQTQLELHALRDTIKKQQKRIELLDDEKGKLEQESRMITRHSIEEKECQEIEMQRHKKTVHEAHYHFQLKIQKLEQRIEQSADQLRVAEEQLNIERSRNIKLLKKRTPYEKTVEKPRVMTETYESERSRNHMLSNEKSKCERTVDTLREVNQELESKISMSVTKDKFEGKVEKLRVLNETLEYEMSQNNMLSKERNKYKEQVEHMADYHAFFKQEDQKSKYLQITTEKNQQLERQLYSLKKSEQVLTGEIDSRNNEIRGLRYDLKCKDIYISKLQNELRRQYQEIDERVSELVVIKETNVKYERLVSDLQTEIDQYKSNLACTRPASSKLTNTVSKLKCEVEYYQRELEKARVEIQNAAKNRLHVERICSDIKKSEQACRVTVNSLNEKVRELTKRKDGDINNLQFECQRKCKELENAKTELSLIKEQNKTNEQLVTDLQIELGQYKRNLKDKDSYSAKMSNTITNLRLEVETYQSGLNHTRDELRNATEISLKKTEQAFIDERGSLNDKVRELTNMLKRKDSDVRMMETKMAEISSIEEKNIKLERHFTELQSEVNQYRSDLNDKSSATAKLIYTISNLRREAETYQSELNQARNELRNATEKIQQMERHFSDTKKTDQTLIDETGFLNDKILNLTNILKRKESDVRKMETQMAELYSIEEKNNQLERQVTDLQTEVNRYESDLNDKSSASAKLTNTILNLRLEAETYQSELSQARDELRNATEKTQQMERQISDLKKSDQAFINERGSLNDKIRELTNSLKRKDSDVREMEEKMAEFSSIEEKNNKLERQVTDLQTEVNRYESDLNDKSSTSTKLTYTISNLRREAETYQSELNQARDELRNATEKTQQMERQFSNLKKSDQAFTNEGGSLNDKIQELTNILKRKDSDVRKMETKMAEISSIEEKNIKLERQVTDLQSEVNQYRSDLNDKSSASTELTNTISNLRREAETYQSELNQARDELRNATEKTQQMERQISDLKKSDQAFTNERGSLNDKIQELTNILKRKDSDVRKMETKMAEVSSIEDKNIKLERQVTDLQSEVNQYRSDLNDKSSASAKLTNTISNLRREAETYQRELNQARDELRNATENIQQIERQFSDTKNTNQTLIDETGFLNDKIRELTNILKRKDSDVREMKEKMAEFSSVEEKNNKLERQVTDLQTEVNRYESDMNDKSSASTKLTNTISNLRREAETYQSELNQARDKLRNSTEKTKQMERQTSDLKKSDQSFINERESLNDKIQELTNILKRKDSDVRKIKTEMERQISDLKKSDQAFINERGSLNDKIREITNILKRKDSDVRMMETKMAEISSVEEKNIKLERQVTDLQTEVNQYRSELNEKCSASTKLTNTISNLRREAKTYQSELSHARDELRIATDNTQHIERQISDLKRSEQVLIDERGSLNDNIRQLTDILKGKDSDIQRVETKMAEFSLMKEENAKAQRQITDLQIEIKQYESELKDKSGNLTKQNNTISNLSHESERCKSELKEAYEKIMKLDQQLKTVNDEHEKCNHLISSLRKENAKLSMYKDNDKTRRSEATLSQREHELSLALEKSRRELREVQHELDDTKIRLSKVMGQKLTDNNPNIADLSDKNRPTKLAERYSELYDNQWTDAFEVICNQLHNEQSTIESLIDILMNAANYCREEAMTQLETIQGILLPQKTGSTFPSLVHKNLKDCRKALGEQTGAAIYEKYLQDIAKQRQQSLQLDVKPYVKECVELCWLMSIQDPPVVVAPELQHGANFDTDFYKAYTKSGPLVDYVVWPALCLHEKGPLLCKGIAQGYGGKKTKY